MMFRAAALCALLLGIGLGTTPAARGQNSFEVPRDQILAKVHRVGLMPIALAEDLKDRSEVKERYEQLLAERLQKLGEPRGAGRLEDAHHCNLLARMCAPPLPGRHALGFW